MATFFKTFSEFKNQVGGAVNQSLQLDSIGPYIDVAEQKHLRVWLGDEFWEELLTEYAKASPSSEMTKLFPLLQKPLAYLGVYEHSFIGGVQISDMGLIRMENDNSKTAYKYQINDLRSSMINNGFEAIEVLLKFLYANKGDYPTWRDSSAFARSRSLFLNYASEFRASYAKYVSRYTYESLRSLIEDIEEFALRPLLGDELYDGMKERILEDSLATEEKKLLPLLHKAIAHFAIEEGIKQNLVKIEGTKVLQRELLGDQSLEKGTLPGQAALSLSLNTNELWANRHMSLIRRYLVANATKLSWEDPNQEEEPTSTELDRCYPDPCTTSNSSDKIISL